MNPIIFLATTLYFATLTLSSTAQALPQDPYAKQRQLFIEANEALATNKKTRYKKLKKSLQQYPLYSYLIYAEMRKKMKTLTGDQVADFLRRYQDMPTARRFYYAWLHYLGKNRRWKDFDRFYQPSSSTTLQCYHLRSQIQRAPENNKETLKKALEIWLVGKSQPDACDPIFKKLKITTDHRWERIRRAFNKNQPGLARHIGKKLPEDGKMWLSYWHEAHRKPEKALAKTWTKQDTEFVRSIIKHGLLRLARSKADVAHERWQSLSKTHKFSEEDRGKILHDIALHAALDRIPGAQNWLNQVPETAITPRLRRWRVRTALLNEDWNAALMWIEMLPPAERNSHQWQYWKATSLENTGEKKQALATFKRMSDDRNYYSFLAADKLNLPYSMNDAKETIDTSLTRKIENMPAVIRAREFYLAGIIIDARREWQTVISHLNKQELMAAARVAHDWGWHGRAIATAAQAKYWSDLDMRFPLAHRQLIDTNAEKYQLDPALIYGVIRQESAFMREAQSHVGALGLMQLMPATAKSTSKYAKLRYRGKQSLLKPETNITLGSAYFKKLLDKYDGSPVLAATAYNAGPHRVARWRPSEKPVSAALWILRIPFRETHGYVQKILAYATVFDWRAKRPLVRLKERMPDVLPTTKDGSHPTVKK